MHKIVLSLALLLNVAIYSSFISRKINTFDEADIRNKYFPYIHQNYDNCLSLLKARNLKPIKNTSQQSIPFKGKDGTRGYLGFTPADKCYKVEFTGKPYLPKELAAFLVSSCIRHDNYTYSLKVSETELLTFEVGEKYSGATTITITNAKVNYQKSPKKQLIIK